MSANGFDQECIDAIRSALVVGLAAIAELDRFAAGGRPERPLHPFGGPEYGGAGIIANALMLVESMIAAVPAKEAA